MSMLAAVACSMVLPTILGTFWFSSFFLGRPWLRYAFGEKGGPKRDAMPAVFLATNIGYALTFSLQYILLRNVIGASSVEDCVKFTGYVVGILVGSQVSHYAFGERPVGQYVIEQLFNVVILLGAAAIIAVVG